MKYSLSFGGRSPIIAEGNVEGESLILFYELEKVSYKLTVSSRRVLHETLGDGLSLEFREGEETCGTLRLGSRSAPYPVHCTSLKITPSSPLGLTSGFSALIRFTAPQSPTQTVTFVVHPTMG